MLTKGIIIKRKRSNHVREVPEFFRRKLMMYM